MSRSSGRPTARYWPPAGRWRHPAGGRLERWPLSYQGQPVGVLVAGPRRGEQAFDPRDRAVLGEIARQAGAAVHAQALTADLLASRQQLISAREEERRRLRRDLHDGLGPLLTGAGLTIDAARARGGRGEAGAVSSPSAGSAAGRSVSLPGCCQASLPPIQPGGYAAVTLDYEGS